MSSVSFRRHLRSLTPGSMLAVMRCAWCEGPESDVTWRGVTFHAACWARRHAVLEADERDATIHRLKVDLRRAEEDRDDLAGRLAAAFQEIRTLRAQLDKPRLQVAETRANT